MSFCPYDNHRTNQRWFAFTNHSRATSIANLRTLPPGLGGDNCQGLNSAPTPLQSLDTGVTRGPSGNHCSHRHNPARPRAGHLVNPPEALIRCAGLGARWYRLPQCGRLAGALRAEELYPARAGARGDAPELHRIMPPRKFPPVFGRGIASRKRPMACTRTSPASATLSLRWTKTQKRPCSAEFAGRWVSEDQVPPCRN